MSDFIIIPKETLQEICNAIREKENTIDKIKVNEIASRILEIETGGSGDPSASVIKCGNNVYLKASTGSSILMSAYNSQVYLNPEPDSSIDYDRLYQIDNGVLLLSNSADGDIPTVTMIANENIILLSPVGDGNNITISNTNGYTEVIINE